MDNIGFYYPGCTGVVNIINDDTTSTETTWSSQKIQDELDSIDTCCIDDDNISSDKTWSSQKIVDYYSTIDCGTF